MSFQAFFEPNSVAVVGASREKGKVGHEILASVIRGGYEGKVFPVNPNADEIAGLRCYPDLKSIGETPDLVVITVPAGVVLSVIRECADIKVRSAVIVTAGFREVGEEGGKLERSILETARAANIRLLGPNCVGLIATGKKLNASFAGELPARGGVGYFSQSGSILSAILDMATATDIGFSKLVSIGNKADIDELEVLRALGEDEETNVIAGYLENITDREAFLREAERIARDKPILLIKAGETGAGALAASSHTGALVRQAAPEGVFERAGVIRCNSIKAQFDFARALASQPLPAGPGVVVIANGGGPSIMAADAIERAGLRLAELDDEAVGKLSAELPPAASVHNPIDLLGDAPAGRFELALRAALESPGVDTVLVLVTPHAMTRCTETAEMIVRVARERGDKPILAAFIGSRKVAEAVRVLRKGRVPRYDCPESAVETIKVMTRYARWRSRS